MEYKSPLGYNFKLERSLSTSQENENRESPRRNNSTDSGNRRSRKFFDSNNRRNSGYGNYDSPQQKYGSPWSSPRGNVKETNSIEDFYHPSMLENPWEELERNLNVSGKD